MKKRLFISIDIPKNIRMNFDRLKEYPEIKNLIKNSQGKFTKTDNLHITLSFLDNCDESIIPGIIELIKDVCGNINPFTLKFQKIIFGPPGRFSKMIWAVFYANSYYSNLQNNINEKIVEYFRKTKHQILFNSHKNPVIHITLLRLREKIKPFEIEFQTDDKEFEVKRVSLMESKLTQHGPIYNQIADIKFG